MASLRKKTWGKFANVTTIHGVPDLTTAKTKWTRLLWGLVMLGALSILGYMLYSAVAQYLAYPTTLSANYNKLMDKFPPIRVNVLHFIDLNKAQSLNLGTDHVCMLLGYFQDLMPYSLVKDGNGFNPNQTYSQQLKDEIKAVAANNTKTGGVMELVELLSFESYEIFASVESLVEDTSEPTVSKIVDKFGVSYIVEALRVEPDPDSRNYDPEIAGGFQLNLSAYNDMTREKNQFGYYSEQGAYSDLTSRCWDNTNLSLIFVLTVDTNIGYLSVNGDIIIQADYTHTLNKRNDPCADGEVTMTKCYDSCQKNITRSAFGEGGRMARNAPALVQCAGSSELQFFDNSSDPAGEYMNIYDAAEGGGCTEMIDLALKCKRSCVRPCKSWVYEVTEPPSNIVETSSLGEFTFKVKMAPRWGWKARSALEENYLFTVPILLSNIGGLLGLFMGASMISVLQLLAYGLCGTWLRNHEAG